MAPKSTGEININFADMLLLEEMNVEDLHVLNNEVNVIQIGIENINASEDFLANILDQLNIVLLNLNEQQL